MISKTQSLMNGRTAAFVLQCTMNKQSRLRGTALSLVSYPSRKNSGLCIRRH